MSSVLWGYLPGIWSVFVFFIASTVIPIFIDWLRVFILVQKLPGPQGHPFFGNAVEFLSKQNFLHHASKWRENFPHFHKTFAFFHPIIMIQSPEAVQTILGRNKHSEKGLIYKGLKPLLGEGLITSRGEKWHAHRKLITPTFHFNILESFVDIFVDRTKDFMNMLEKADKSDYIDIRYYVQKLTLDFICETAMGISVQAQLSEGKQPEIVEAIHRLEEIGIYRMIRPWLLSDFVFQFTEMGRKQEKYKRILHNFTDKVILERKEALKNQSEEHNIPGKKKKAIFMDLLIESSKNGEELTDKDIREEVTTFMFAGQNTTQLAIVYCLYLLGLNPDVQKRVQQEMAEIFGTSDREPTINDLKEMRYLERCIKEALRLFPSVPVIARKLTEDEKMGKYLLPKNSDILILPYVLHRDPKQFPNPEKFDPDNFLPERVKQRHPYAYIPFSAGPRNCIGQKFAILAEKTVISSLIRKYQISSKYGRNDLVVVPITVLVPKTGIRLKLIERNLT